MNPEIRAGDRVPRLAVNTKPAHQVECVAFDPSGRVLASGSWDMNIEIWDVQSQHLLRTLRGHAGRVTAVAFDRTGEVLASGGGDGRVRLWNVRTGQQLQAWSAGLIEHPVRLAFARDDQLVVSTTDDGSVRWWERATGVEVHAASLPKGLPAGSCVPSADPRRVAHHDLSRRVTLWDPGAGEIAHPLPVMERHDARALAFSCDGSVLATGHLALGPERGASQPLVKIWDCATGAELAALRGHDSSVTALAFDPDGALLASLDSTGAIAIWDCRTWERCCAFQTGQAREGNDWVMHAMALQRGGKVLAMAEGHHWIGRIRLWDTVTGAQLGAMERRTGDINCVTIDPRSHCLAAAGEDGKVRLWPLVSGGAPVTLDGHRSRIGALAYSNDGRTLASASNDCTARLWDTTSSTTVAVIDAPHELWAIAVSPDGTAAVTSGERADLRLWDTSSGAALRVLRASEPAARDIGTEESSSASATTGTVHCVALSPDGRILVEGGTSATWLWDLTTGTVLHVLETHSVWRVAFHPTRSIMATGGFDQVVRLWNVETGTLVAEIATGVAAGTIESGVAIAFRPDGAVLAGGGADGVVRLWDAGSGAVIATVPGAHTAGVTSVAFDASGHLLATGSFDASVVLWNVLDPAQPRPICTLYAFSDGRWAVLDPEGRFDASDAGNVPWLSWVVGMEPIALDQLKERYYEPQLLRKLLASTSQSLGAGDEPLRDVPTLAEVDLYPAMELLPRDASDPRIRVRLTDRGGGIGRVVVSVNGKEIASDARGGGCDPSASEHLIEVDLNSCPLLRPGEVNVCEIRVHNAAGYLVSRDLPSIYHAPAASYEPPTLWAIVAGISAYRGDDLKLRFAADDAEKVATALRIGGEQLFGSEHVHVQLLTAPASPNGRAALATRRNLEQAFETAAQKARSTDVLVVFLAGHGTSHDGEYYYYTHDAMSGELDDPGVRSLTALSSERLTALFKRVAANKQVLILDTCAAGVLIERWGHARALPSSQIRALERMKDRMGLYILAGSTADKRAYESSKYNQGILTYSLLFGMRGPALVDEEIDVAQLFNHAVEQVPRLAGNVGGVQRPLVGIPRGGHSFPIGLLRAADRDRIPIVRDIPVVLLAVLEDEADFEDPLELSRRVNDALRDQKVALVDVEMSDAYRLKGRYAVHGDALRLRARIRRGTQNVTEIVMDGDPRDPERVTQDLVARFLAEIERSSAPVPSVGQPAV